jgi:hypothetical protein
MIGVVLPGPRLMDFRRELLSSRTSVIVGWKQGGRLAMDDIIRIRNSAG